MSAAGGEVVAGEETDANAPAEEPSKPSQKNEFVVKLPERADDNKNYEPRINQEWVQVLINLRMKHAKSFTRKRHSAINAWTAIYNEMLELGAPPHITIEKIKKKWMNLVARYKHFKFVVNTKGSVSWPYFDQIDRAYERNPGIIELRRNFNCTSMKAVDGESDNESMADYADTLMKKQQFTSILVQLRYTYKHMFTGKKYAAQRGWMMIKSLHPEGDKYTVDQFSKCWQNLTQRYRTLLETEKDHAKITWMHFPTMHRVFVEESSVARAIRFDEPTEASAPPPPAANATRHEAHDRAQCAEHRAHAELELDAFDDRSSELFDEEEDNQDNSMLIELLTSSKSSHLKRRRADGSDDFSECDLSTSHLDDLLKYMIQRDVKLDEQHDELMKLLRSIRERLD